MIISFSNASGNRSMNWQTASDLLFSWMCEGRFPESSSSFVPPPRDLRSDDYPDLFFADYFHGEVESAADQILSHIYYGSFTALSPEDGRSFAEFLRRLATRRYACSLDSPGGVTVRDVSKRAPFLTDLAGFLDSATTRIAVCKQDEENGLEQCSGEPAAVGPLNQTRNADADERSRNAIPARGPSPKSAEASEDSCQQGKHKAGMDRDLSLPVAFISSRQVLRECQ